MKAEFARTTWRLHNALTDKGIASLGVEEAQKICHNIPSSDRAHWYGWRPGWTEWKCISDIQELNAKQLQVEATQKAPPPPLHLAPQTKSKSGPERRQNERFQLALRVVIVGSGQTFKSQTIDVSTGGFKLRDPIPWKATQGPCRVFLLGPDQQEALEFTARIAMNSQNHSQIAFIECDQLFQRKLNRWLDCRRKQQKSSLKGAA
jgi:hypothetical protein